MAEIPFPGGAADQDVFFHEDKVCVYHKAINTWECRTVSTGGSDAGQPAAVTTQTVYTIPISTTDGSVNRSPRLIADLRTQYDVNWFIADNIEQLKKDVAFLEQQVGGLSKIFVGENKPNNDYDQWSFWYNPVTGEFFYWDTDQDLWLLVNADRPPIFSDTEPTEHPNFNPPENELIQGDVWIDITDPDELIQYIYDGNDWIKTGGNYVHREGGDDMEGPLEITGGRTPNADGLVSTVRVLNVDSGQDSDLQLRHNGNAKVYVGKTQTTTTQGIKFNSNNLKITGSGDAELFTMNTNGVFYEGAYTTDKHIATKKDVEDAIDELKVATEDYYNNLVFTEPDPAINTMPLLNAEQPHTWAGGGANGQLWFDINNLGYPYHIGFKAPTDLSPYDEDLAIKFTHDSGVMYARIASRWHSGQVHLNLKDVVGDILVDGEQTTKIEVQDSIFVERAGDSMTGNLVMDDAMIEFPNIAADATAIRMKRAAGEDATLLRLENNSAGNVENFYNIRLGGNSHYNGLQIKGGSGADELVWRVRSGASGQMHFFKDVFFEGNTLQNIGTAVNDTDAVPYGQVKQELQEFRDDLVTELSFGTWRYQSGSTTPLQGRFYASTASVPIANADPRTVTSFNLHELDYFGNAGAFDRINVGGMLVFRQGGLEARYRINSTPATNGSSNEARRIEVNFVSRNQSFYFVDGTDWSVQLIELKDIDADALDDTYLRIDCDNSPLVSMSGLEIKTDPSTGSGFGEAVLTLNGKRDNNNNSAASIKFKNWNYDDSDDVNGYITYRTDGTLAGGFFRFNKNIDLLSHDVYNVNALKLNNPGSIYSANDERIKFKTSTSDTSGSGIIEIQRPNSTPRRGFAIRGKNTSNIDDDIFFSYTNSSGGDAINYVGKQADNSNNLATTKYVKNYVDNNVTAGATNISISRNTTSVTVQSSTGTNGTISAASSTNAGVMTSSDKSKLDGMSYKIGYGSGNYFITST